MKKIIQISLCLLVLVGLFGCDSDKYNMSKVKFEDKTVVYNGESQSIRVENLPDDVIVSYENNSKIDAGVYEVIASFTCSDTEVLFNDMIATLTIQKASFDMSGIMFNDDVFIHDNLPHSLQIEGTLNSEVSVSYENNEKVEAGEYEVIANFSHDNKNYNTIDSMTAKMIISNDGSYHKVSYIADSLLVASKVVADETELSNLPLVPQKAGYIGTWDYNNEKITSTTTITAIYDIIDYDITYMVGNGVNASLNPTTYNVESNNINLSDPTISALGYQFDGWYTTSSFDASSKVTQITTGTTEDIILYAKWINYGLLNIDGFEYNEEDYAINALITTLPFNKTIIELSKLVKVSDGCSWFISSDLQGTNVLNNDLELVDGSNIVYIHISDENGFSDKYILDVYKIVEVSYEFVANGEDLVSTTPTNQFTSIEEVEAPLIKGYTFIGWSIDSTNTTVTFPYSLKENTVFTAVYEINEYTISFDNEQSDIKVDYLQENINLPTISKDGYTFDGWDVEGATLTTITKYEFDNDISVTAVFTPITYTIAYTEKGSTHDNVTEYTIEDSIVLTNATLLGFEFKGWFIKDTDNEVTTIENSIGDIELEAKFEIITYTITYIENGASSNSNITTYTVESTDTLVELTKDYYQFKEWTINGIVYETFTFDNTTGNLTIEVIFVGTEYSITYEKYDGAITKENVETYSLDDGEIKLNLPFKDGIYLATWCLEEELTTKVTTLNIDLLKLIDGADDASVVQFTLYAKYAADDISVYKEKDLFNVERTYLEFGSYPQEFVSSVSLHDQLDTLAQDSANLNDRGYYELEGIEYARIVASVQQGSVFNSGDEIVNGQAYFFEVAPIKWRVLVNKEGSFEAVSEFVLFSSIFDNSTSSFDSSYLNNVLNTSFVNEILTQEEQMLLSSDKLSSTTFDLINDTTIFDNNNSKVAFVTDYAHINGCSKSRNGYTNGYGTSAYWLSTNGNSITQSYVVTTTGTTSSVSKTGTNGVRPSISFI